MLFLFSQSIENGTSPNVVLPLGQNIPSVRPMVKKPDKNMAIAQHQSRFLWKRVPIVTMSDFWLILWVAFKNFTNENFKPPMFQKRFKENKFSKKHLPKLGLVGQTLININLLSD